MDETGTQEETTAPDTVKRVGGAVLVGALAWAVMAGIGLAAAMPGFVVFGPIVAVFIAGAILTGS